jgi:hypothetical protein
MYVLLAAMGLKTAPLWSRMMHACRLEHEEGWGWVSGGIVHDGDKAGGWLERLWFDR